MSIYKGLFIRDNMHDTGTIPSAGVSPTYSPDIICYQSNVLSPVDAESSYDRCINKAFLQDMPNNIYVRAKNNADVPMNGKVKAFCAPINVLYIPSKWQPLKTQSGKQEVSLIHSSMLGNNANTAVPVGRVALSEEAFYLTQLLDPNMHTCIMGLTTNADGTSYINLPSSFSGDGQLWNFLRNTPQIAYNNIEIVQPFAHTFSQAIDFGNYDPTSRKFVLQVEIEKGLDTLVGSTLLIQSTNVHAPFSFPYTITANRTTYASEYTLDKQFFGNFNFSITMPKYDQVRAGIHVQNLALNTPGENMTPTASLRYTNGQGAGETATMLGDYYFYIGMEPAAAPASCARKTLSLPTLEIEHQA